MGETATSRHIDRARAGVEQSRYMLSHLDGVHGFFGASSVERLPVEKAIEENARAFKGIDLSQ